MSLQDLLRSNLIEFMSYRIKTYFKENTIFCCSSSISEQHILVSKDDNI